MLKPGILGHLPPAERRRGVGQVAEQSPWTWTSRSVPRKPVGDQRADERVAGQAVGAGDDHRRQLGTLARAVEHPLGLAGVHRHPGLGQDVLAGVERRQGDRAVQVGPGADDDGVDLVVVDQVLPARRRSWGCRTRGRPGPTTRGAGCRRRRSGRPAWPGSPGGAAPGRSARRRRSRSATPAGPSSPNPKESTARTKSRRSGSRRGARIVALGATRRPTSGRATPLPVSRRTSEFLRARGQSPSVRGQSPCRVLAPSRNYTRHIRPD